MSYFYPRPPRGGRPIWEKLYKTTVLISIHALREEGDRVVDGDHIPPDGISIHALREEGDKLTATRLPIFRNFYPRPPRGGRHRRR